jgi:hypothetical protein
MLRQHQVPWPTLAYTQPLWSGGLPQAGSRKGTPCSSSAVAALRLTARQHVVGAQPWSYAAVAVAGQQRHNSWLSTAPQPTIFCKREVSMIFVC